jgi:hypothetical protein
VNFLGAAPHFQNYVSGVLVVLMDDGTKLAYKPGDDAKSR